MRRVLSSALILLLAVLHAPSQAQALLFLDLLPADLLPLTTNEPAMLFLTGLALLGLARLGVPRRGRGMPEHVRPASVAEEAPDIEGSHSLRRAA